MKKIILLTLFTLANISCNETINKKVENQPEEIFTTSDPLELIQSKHKAEINAAKLSPNNIASYTILKYSDEYVNTISVNKKLEVDEIMTTKDLKAWVILYSYSLGKNAYKDDILLIEDPDGNLKYKNTYFSTYSKDRRIKSIATIIDNWVDGNSINDYYGIDD